MVEKIVLNIHVNPELGKKPSVETLHDVPKAKAMVKRKSRLQTINIGSENYSSMNQ